ncbi:hypothetical protein PALB_13330 [Pseudoalteromonas luteoviolacea B = ATCC 29581]|nr:hypothetical protein PALB_13330 [Pseudoalteromonas luteoviolacea B = ATCC 29581]
MLQLRFKQVLKQTRRQPKHVQHFAKYISPLLWATYHQVFFQLPTNKAVFRTGAIISLCAPYGRAQSEKVTNNTLLRANAIVNQCAHPHFFLYGGDESMKYKEKSVLVSCDKNRARALSIALKQNAFYWIDENRLTLICSLTGFESALFGDIDLRLL